MQWLDVRPTKAVRYNNGSLLTISLTKANKDACTTEREGMQQLDVGRNVFLGGNVKLVPVGPNGTSFTFLPGFEI